MLNTMTPPTAVSRRARKRRATEAAPVIDAPARQDWSNLDPNDLSSPALYINRELSWLAFNERVLAQAQDASHPLLERVKFLAISGTNLDEFFMVRVATILKKFRAGIEDVSIDGQTTDQQLATIRSHALAQIDDQTTCWSQSLRPLLADAVLRPRLEAEHLDPVRRLALQALEGLSDDPQHLVMLRLAERFLPAPYNRTGYGHAQGLEAAAEQTNFTFFS